MSRHPDAATFVGGEGDWRDPAVLEGGTKLKFGETELNAIAVTPPSGASPGLVLMEAEPTADGEHPAPRSWASLPTSFQECARVEVELIEIEGLEQSGVLMTQLLCDRATIPAERLSSTALIRLDPGTRSAEVLWQGEGWSLNDRELCLAYEVYSFRASKDATRVEVLLDREVVRTAEPGVAVECEPEPFGQESVEVIELVRPGDPISVPAGSPDRAEDEAEDETSTATPQDVSALSR